MPASWTGSAPESPGRTGEMAVAIFRELEKASVRFIPGLR